MAKAEKKAEKFKVVCLQNFRDKHTFKIHEKGDIFEVTEERFEEILKVGKLVKKHTKPKVEK
jgi:hypothetical protein